ncbi:MAG: sugar ABC transporter substrate-binding protein [Candidatus Aquicultor secundus]|uniref:Sugar ABC transporter substrate-binding protein n=1 Tax=Candidatus Aquicultor secundus TaxID=1973895 RepID=A0A2M7T6G9_9ACTN|nr:cyclodeaminase/cyclohydrolase family protein [Candidatus Aquicultor secundus]NCO66273.1 cyclodeaminase/cyclohydrolase family protein [Solirubrobacter sp.]OIO87566.1 MAG: sugar ABC transporter substrate-binding protein [Candidatus Aquicultor secundus]PIU26721.1 MAG: sugar ABC transporter substrate-binding protein [Candidatus Aquicultor secundus]PIW21774.1 MAG: sugar ABC transporter substrate-binding protein [Candidatus Aquicultor secundus]PIX53204.1 MAG: sugar ABC transporter substrate-bindi
MGMLDKSCKDFLDVLASKEAVPGGGGAAAAGGAIGMALSNMVGNLTVGKKKYAEVEDEVKDLLDKGYKVMAELETLVDRDAEVFEPLSKAYGMPKETEEQQQAKADALEKYSKEACSVPMEIMRKSYEGIQIHNRMGQIGSMLAISDVGCGVVFLKSALISGMLNVVINLNTIKDQDFVSSTRNEMNRLLSDGSKLADETLQLVLDKLTK